jgi:hypothetical protein
MRIDDELRQVLDRAAARSGRPVAHLVEEVLRRTFIDEVASLEQRVAKIEQIVARFDGRHRADIRVLKELIGSYVYLFMLHNPQLPDGARDAAHDEATGRMANFARLVSENLKAGESLLRAEDLQPLEEGLAV